jgi:hypothetical protein
VADRPVVKAGAAEKVFSWPLRNLKLKAAEKVYEKFLWPQPQFVGHVVKLKVAVKVSEKVPWLQLQLVGHGMKLKTAGRVSEKMLPPQLSAVGHAVLEVVQ